MTEKERFEKKKIGDQTVLYDHELGGPVVETEEPTAKPAPKSKPKAEPAKADTEAPKTEAT